MRRILALLLLLAIPAVTVAGDNGYKVIYDGGSLTDTKTVAKENTPRHFFSQASLREAESYEEMSDRAPAMESSGNLFLIYPIPHKIPNYPIA